MRHYRKYLTGCQKNFIFFFIEMSARRPHDTYLFKHQDNLDFEIRFFEGLVAESPDFLDALIALAEAYTKRGLVQKGMETDEKITRLRPQDPLAHYNLACSYALLGKITEALTSIQRALQSGYRDLPHMVQDSDLENLRKDPRLRELLLRFFPPKAGPPPAGKPSHHS